MKSENSRQAHMKGGAMRSFIEWYDREVAPGAIREAATHLPDEHAEAFSVDRHDLGVLASRWYRAETIHAVLDTLLAADSEQTQADLAHRGSEAVVTDIRRGIYRVLFDWFLTPGRYSKIVDRIWQLSYDNGHIVTTVLGPNRHKGVVVEWRGHHRFLCMFNVAIKRSIYAAMGCKGARIQSRYCVDDGDDECGSIIVWDSDEDA